MLWYNDVEAIPFGRGALVFRQYRLLDLAGDHPLAARLAADLVQLARRLTRAGSLSHCMPSTARPELGD